MRLKLGARTESSAPEVSGRIGNWAENPRRDVGNLTSAQFADLTAISIEREESFYTVSARNDPILLRQCHATDASRAEEERPESAEEPVAQRQAGRPPATATKHDQLLLEHEILGDHRSHATGAIQLRNRDGQMEQGEQEVLHA